MKEYGTTSDSGKYRRTKQKSRSTKPKAGPVKTRQIMGISKFPFSPDDAHKMLEMGYSREQIQRLTGYSVR